VSKVSIGIRKLSKKGIKHFVHLYKNVRACACLSVLEKKLNNLRWNERILLTFSGSVQLCTGNIWAVNSNQLACRYGPRQFLQYLSPKFLSYGDITYLFANLKTRDKNNDFDFWGKA
jgi:hypothetical protein